jgi:hypothetical protein
MAITHFTEIFHVPTILAFGWSFTTQHHLALLSEVLLHVIQKTVYIIV